MIPEFLRPFAAQLESQALASIHITATPLKTDRPASAASKFRGLPQLPLGVPYPTGPNGQPLLLLAQINLAELPANAWRPAAGLLQFYVPAHDWYDADDSRVLYLGPEHAGAPQHQDFSFLPPNHYADSPIGCEHRLTFAPVMEYGSFEDERSSLDFHGQSGYEYENTLPPAEKEAFGKLFAGSGHKLGGYATFAQGDPRSVDPAGNMPLQLLQIDMDKHIMFGDAGVAHFFIDPQALRNQEFEKAWFYWDCC